MSSFWIKILALAAMTVDHVGFLIFPDLMWMRIIGRIAFPIFAYCAAEGARYTHNRRRYMTRLLLWGLVAEVPFDLLSSGSLFSMDSQNVCFTLAAGVACVWLLERMGKRGIVPVVLLLAAVTLLASDYSFPGVLAVMLIHYYAAKQQPVRGTALACAVTSLCFGPLQLFSLAAVIPIALYNGRRGPNLKYLFYLYYPLHMLVIWVVFNLAG